MLNLRKFGVVLTATAIVATSTFADDRPRNESWRGERNRGRYEDGRHDRQNNISAQGRVTALHREGDGYRLQLDRGRNWYYVPSHAWRNRDRGLRIGISVRLGGGYYDSRGWVHCSSADWIDDGYGYRDGGYGSDFVSGTVQRIDYGRDVLQLRDERTGRRITVDMRRADRRGRDRGRVHLDDLRRGDYVELEGDWVRGGLFRAYRVDTVDSRRW